MSYVDILRAQLRIDEGWKRFPYRDTVGKLSGGCGRNLDDVGLSDDEIAYLLDNDIVRATKTARALVPAFENLSDNRKAVIVNLAFNLGNRLASFTQTLRHINAGEYDLAAEAMLDSLWAKQVGKRAERLATMMRIG